MKNLCEQTSFQGEIVVINNQNYSKYFTDELLFDEISNFLHISDLLILCQVNKQLNRIIQQKCKKIIQSHRMFLITSKTAIHQMRFYFDRCLIIFKKKDVQLNVNQNEKKQKQKDKQKDKYQKKKDNQDNEKSNYISIRTVQNPFKYKTITYFQVGVVFTVCLTIDNQAFIFKTCKLINPNNQITFKDYEKITNILQIKTKSDYLTILKDNGEIYRYFGIKNESNSIIEKEEFVQWSSFMEIQDIQASFNYTIFKPKKTICYEQFCKFILGYDIQLVKKDSIQQEQISPRKKTQPNSTLILYNNITSKYNLIQFDKKHNFTQIAIGKSQAYFLNDNHECYICNFQEHNNENNQNLMNQNKIMKAKLFLPFQGKTIVKISSGYNFYMALERQIHNVEKWTIEQVCKWVREIGFPQFVKIFMAEKVDGKKLLTIDKNYMYSNLGITKLNMQQKFMMLLQEFIDNKNKVDTLYGWGKNQNGQLGSRNANYIKQPTKIKLTCIKQNQYIDSIFCEWFQTFIRTQKGRIYRTIGNNQKKKKIKEKQEIKEKGMDYIQGKKTTFDAQSDNDEQNGYDQKHSNNKDKNIYKKRRKNTQDLTRKDNMKKYYNNGHKKFLEQEKWVQCEQGKAFFVRGYKDVVFYIQCPSQKHFEPMKQKKLRTAKMLLNKIIWCFQPNVQEEYKVGYQDKDMGLIQTSIQELRMFDFNENRIKYIKKNGAIVWDRENKIDHFN